METIYDTIIIPKAELGTLAALGQIITRLLLTKPIYWKKMIERHQCRCVLIGYIETNAQVSALEKIIRLINKGITPADNIIDSIPQVWMPLNSLLNRRKLGGFDDSEVNSIKKALRKRQIIWWFIMLLHLIIQMILHVINPFVLVEILENQKPYFMTQTLKPVNI
jgi:hypothetical protein